MPTWLKKLFALNLQNRQPVANAPSSGGKFDPKKIAIKRVGYAFVSGGGSGSRASFEGPSFDFEEIERAYNTDSYIKQSMDKYTDLMFKAGWHINGKNDKAVEYIRLRLAMIALATGQPTDHFFVEMADNLVKYSNVFVAKARNKNGFTLPGVNAQGIYGGPPIGGYFVLPVSTIQIARDINGTVKKYQQQADGAPKPLEFKPEDVIHIYYKRETGRAYGTPFVIPVLDDVRLLREVEENVARLIYRHLHPLYVYKVGLPQPGFEATDKEIEAVRSEIEDMPTDGGIVLPERHTIEAVGADGQALNAYEYLKHFEQRVFTGLGVSEVVMGRGNTANRGTADNMTTEMHDRVKALQKVYSIFVNSFIIDELLMEGGFDPVANPDDDVQFVFKEIALDEKIKLENHELQKFVQNGQTFEDFRNHIGEDPVVDESRLFFNMITIPIAQATAEAKAAASPPASSSTSASHEPTLSPHSKVSEASYRHGLKVGTYADQLNRHYRSTRDDVVDFIREYYLSGSRKFPNYEPKEIDMIMHLTKEQMVKAASEYTKAAFEIGVEDARKKIGATRGSNADYKLYTRQLEDMCGEDVERLMKDLSKTISSILKKTSESDAIADVTGVFNALQYRLSFMATSELMRSYNYGFAMAGKVLDRDAVYVMASEDESNCDRCSDKNGTMIKLNGKRVLENLPPWHPNCTCTLTFEQPE